MGNRVVMQVIRRNRNGEVIEFGPAVYGHWSGDDTPDVIDEFKERAAEYKGNVDLLSAEILLGMVRAAKRGDEVGNYALRTVEGPLDRDARYPNAGAVLIDADTFACECFGGYLTTIK